MAIIRRPRSQTGLHHYHNCAKNGIAHRWQVHGLHAAQERQTDAVPGEHHQLQGRTAAPWGIQTILAELNGHGRGIQLAFAFSLHIPSDRMLVTFKAGLKQCMSQVAFMQVPLSLLLGWLDEVMVLTIQGNMHIRAPSLRSASQSTALWPDHRNVKNCLLCALPMKGWFRG